MIEGPGIENASTNRTQADRDLGLRRARAVTSSTVGSGAQQPENTAAAVGRVMQRPARYAGPDGLCDQGGQPEISAS
ncbi:hypothetical protein [Micromonospora sp. NPDC023814]|uniref:hypothetical protein n=1 Tax=Micromonospora sp. NPDC023814 TaxID=3154596 RepID=UPI003408EC5E